MRQDVYRAAFDEANAELSEIVNKFEQLRQRKDRIEKVVEMLKPMAGVDGTIEPPASKIEPPAPKVVEEAPAPIAELATEVPELATVGVRDEVEPISEPMQRHSENGTDPFQRRIDSALGLSGGLRDSREFGRRFNGTFQRG